MIEVKIPEMGDSIQEAVIANWLKKEGDRVKQDEAIAELETDKATVEIYSPAEGILKNLKRNAGENVMVHEAIAEIHEDSVEDSIKEGDKKEPRPNENKNESNEVSSPAAEKLIRENQINILEILGTGKHGIITKQDVLLYLEKKGRDQGVSSIEKKSSEMEKVSGTDPKDPAGNKVPYPGRKENIVPMSKLRQTIARRLVQAQQTSAILTTFNEVDMSQILELRTQYKERFKEIHNVGLGFMSFFTKACIHALKEFPAINSEVREDNIVYKDFFDIGIAVGGPKGLVVPIIRDVEYLSFSQIEMEIFRLAEKVRNGTITLDEMKGGTFTISNGGIYGSLMSTPILNPPQSGILGMHKIEKRAMVVNDAIVIRPMMYIALSYDHRIVDGKEAVQFLVKIKEMIEDPVRLLLEV